MRKIVAGLMGAFLLAGAVTAQAASGRWDNLGWIYHDSTAKAPTAGDSITDPDGDASPGVDMTGATVLDIFPDTCDESYSIIATYDFYSSSVSTIDICEDGYVTGTDVDGNRRLGIVNMGLPDLSFGDVVAMPFHDDLLQVYNDGNPSEISVLTGDTCGGATCATIQWANMALQNNPDARLTFQITFLSTGEIVFNYIEMTGAGSDGSGATIGLQDDDATSWNLYSHNTPGAVETAQGVSFAPDTDKDGLSDAFEDADRDGAVDAGETDQADSDSDDDGAGDGGEAFAGTDPNDDADPATVTDADSDGLSSLDEAYLGTRDNDADSDGDTIDDGDEITDNSPPFDPALADSDGDGIDDFTEDDTDGTEARNPADFDALQIDISLLDVDNLAVARDGAGNFHVIYYDDGGFSELGYIMLDRDGEILIDETDIGLAFPYVGNTSSYWRRAIVQPVGRELLFVAAYEPASGDNSGCSQMVIGRIDPSKAAQDGDSADVADIVTMAKPLPDSGAGGCGSDSQFSWNGHFDFKADSAGNAHIAFEGNPDDPDDLGGGHTGVYYRVDGRTGAVLNAHLFHRTCYDDDYDDAECHKAVRPAVAVVGTTAHVLFDESWDHVKYVRFENGVQAYGPAIVFGSWVERIAMATVGGRVFTLLTGGDYESWSDITTMTGALVGEVDQKSGGISFTSTPDTSYQRGNVWATLVPISGGRMLGNWFNEEEGVWVWGLFDSAGRVIGAPYYAQDFDDSEDDKGQFYNVSEFAGTAAHVYRDGDASIRIYFLPLANFSAVGSAGGGSSGCELSPVSGGAFGAAGALAMAVAVAFAFERRRRIKA
ncbi:MAG: hypothetical protein AB1405_14265 [Bdellovibrionota bacterium]